MIELHGWLTIQATYEDVCWSDDLDRMVVKKLQEEIQKLEYFKPEIKAQNGNYFMEFSIYANRMNKEVLEAFELYKKIGEMAEGSYGLIYLYDDEAVAGKENMFQVFVLARGEVKIERDAYLSPIIPIIADAD
jgi:hypothetical protein